MSATASPGLFEFRLPDLGEGIHEAQVLAWEVRPGDVVQPFQALCQVESAKAAVELTSPVGGRVHETRVPEGATAHLGDVLVVIERNETPSPGGEGGGEGSSSAEQEEYFGIVGRPPQSSGPTEPAPPVEEHRVFAAPYVRRLAHDLGVRLEDVPGTGPQGRVRASDVEAHAARRGAPNAPTASPLLAAQPPDRQVAPPTAAAPLSTPADGPDLEQRVPLQGLRKRIAEHMLEAVRHAPQVTSFDLFDVTDLVQAREMLRPTAEAEGVKLTYLPFVVKAVVEALKAEPYANAILDEARSEIVLKRIYNVGFATAVPDGLVVPVVKHADRLSLLEIAREVNRLTETARARRSPPDDLTGGTFTISSFGGFDGSPLYATPILNYPEVAILGVGRVEEQPRVVNGAIVPRHCLGVSFTFDHRVLDGEGASRFLSVLRRYLERPLEFLLRLR